MRLNYVPLVTLSVAAQLPLLALRISMGRMPMGRGTTPAEVMAALSSATPLLFLLGVLAVAAQNAVMVAAAQIYLGEPLNAGAAIGRALRRFLWLIVAYIIVSLAVIIGLVAFILPGFYIAFRLIPLNTVVVLEDRGVFESISRTWTLGGGRVWHMFLTMLLGFLIYIGVAIVGGVLVGILGTMIGALKDPNVAAVFTTAATALVYPLLITVGVVLYYDLRIRHEGFDVEMMTKSMAG